MRRLQTYRSSPRASQHIQYRRSSGSRPEPLLSPLIVEGIVHDARPKAWVNYFALRITNRNSLPASMLDTVQTSKTAAPKLTTPGLALGFMDVGCGIATGPQREPSFSHLGQDPGSRRLSLKIPRDRSRLCGIPRGKWVGPPCARAKL